jgi:hypothetical protein
MKRYNSDEYQDGEWVKFEDVKATMEKIILIMDKGTRNRHSMKVWESKLRKVCRETIGSVSEKDE